MSVVPSARVLRSPRAGALAACILVSCITGDIRVGETLYPPRIPANLVDPKPDRVLVISDTTMATLQTFKVTQFEEPNVDDTLYIRWFVDYERNPAIQQQGIRPPVPVSATYKRCRAASTNKVDGLSSFAAVA